MTRLLLCGLLLLCAACPKKDENTPKDAVELIPVDNEISGWTRSSAMKIAENQTQLFDLIDGPADIYAQNGFVKCVFQNYRGNLSGAPVDLELRVFDMADTTHARTLYHDTRIGTGAETPWTGDNPGTEARIDESLLFAYTIDYWQDKFYAWLSISEKSTAALDVAKLFARNVASAIRDSTD